MSYAAEAKQTYTVELPCKAGTKVFFLDKTNLRVIDCQVSAISAQWVEHNDKMFLSMRVSGIKENYITDCIPEHLGESFSLHGQKLMQRWRLFRKSFRASTVTAAPAWEPTITGW